MAYSAYEVSLQPNYHPLSGAPSCKQQRELYEQERARVSSMAAELGPVAANCHKLRGEYDSAVSAHAVAAEKKARCVAEQTKYAADLSAYTAYTAFKKDCQAYLDAVATYKALVARLDAEAKARLDKYNADYATIDRKNYAISQANQGAEITYAQNLASWQKAKAAYDGYLSAINSMSYSTWMQFESTLSAQPALKNYAWNLRTYLCNASPFRCVPQSWKDSVASKCNVVRGLEGGRRGLGADPIPASTCQYWQYYPTCKVTCPTSVANPGAAPKKPTPAPLLAYPAKPTYSDLERPTWEAYRKSLGVKDMPGCDKTPAVAAPGSRPSCDPNAPLPIVPPQPTCTPPDIPAMPVAPSCEPGLMEQIGSMWLVLAVAGGGLYWYSKRK
jgi:hypothetical protein